MAGTLPASSTDAMASQFDMPTKSRPSSLIIHLRNFFSSAFGSAYRSTDEYPALMSKELCTSTCVPGFSMLPQMAINAHTASVQCMADEVPASNTRPHWMAPRGALAYRRAEATMSSAGTVVISAAHSGVNCCTCSLSSS